MKDIQRKNLYHTFLKEFVLLILIPLFCTTVLLDYTLYIIGICIALSIVIDFCFKPPLKVDNYEKDRIASFETSRLPFISIFRCGVMIYTCIAILAVDFHAFPRRLAKTETFGTSLMDLGVGMFIFSGGLVSRVARDSAKVGSSNNNKKIATLSIPNEIASTIKSVIPMLILGVGRFATTKGVEYQEHTPEYGVHWNFFFTLAFLALFTGILRPLLNLVSQIFQNQPIATSIILFCIGVIVTLTHQYYLLLYNFKEIVLGINRENIFLQNKEGICSLIGFFAIYFIAASIGSIFMRYIAVINNKKRDQLLKTWRLRTVIISIICVIFWTLSYLGYNDFWPIDLEKSKPSRRMANTGYVVWIVAHASGMLLGLLLIDLLQPPIRNRIDSKLNRYSFFKEVGTANSTYLFRF
jgi:glucosaminylphosphatidylinositol acyltransferase